MKKKIILSIIMIISLVLFTAACGKDGKKENASNADDIVNQSAEYVALFSCDTVTELKKVSKEQKIELFESEDKRYFGVSQHKEGELLIDVAAMIEGDNIKNMKVWITFDKDYSKLKDKVGQIQQDINHSVYICSQTFDTEMMGAFKSFNTDGQLLDQDNDKVYENIVGNKAFILSVVKVNDKSYWEINGLVDEEGHYVLSMERIFEKIDDSFADIILE